MDARAQASLEYLMTYGWALILIAAVVGVLVFIVSSPTQTVSFTSNDPTKMMVKAGAIQDTTATAILQNITGGRINITDINQTGASYTLPCTINEKTTDIDVPAGGTMQLECPLSGEYPTGAVTINYTDFAGIQRTTTVRISGVQTGTGPSPPASCEKIENETSGTCYDTITAALAAAETVNGDVIVIQDSDNYSEGTITVDKEITLKGKAGFPKPLIDGGGVSSAIVVDADNVTLQNLRVANATGDIVKQSNAHSGTILTDLEVYNSTGDECVQLKKCTNCTIDNVVAHDCVGDGLNIADNSSNSSIINSEVYNSLSSNWGAIYSYNSSGMTISNNYIHDNTSNKGIYLSKLLGNNTISGNRIEGNSFVAGEIPPDGMGIIVSYFGHDPDTELTNGTFNITENTIINNTGSGIQVTLTTIGGKVYNPGVSGTPTITILNNNVYGNSNMEVYNSSPWDITATNNWWNTVSCAAIEGEVYHSVDDPANGTVDFDPVLNASYPGGASTPCA